MTVGGKLQLEPGQLDTQVLVQSAEGVTDNVKLVSKLLHNAVDAGSVL